MDQSHDRAINQSAFRKLKTSIDQTYPHGQFVAIYGGRIVADAASFKELSSVLKANGKDPQQVLVVQAGIEYPETAVIFAHGIAS